MNNLKITKIRVIFWSKIGRLRLATDKRTAIPWKVRDSNGILRNDKNQVLSWFNWWVSFAPEFQCYYFCESSCLFYLSLNSDFYVSKIMHL